MGGGSLERLRVEGLQGGAAAEGLRGCGAAGLRGSAGRRTSGVRAKRPTVRAKRVENFIILAASGAPLTERALLPGTGVLQTPRARELRVQVSS